MIDLDRLRALAEDATPGPWEQGDVWALAGVLPEKFGEDRCAYCARLGAPAWVGTAYVNDTRMRAHKHHDPEPYSPDRMISRPDGLVVGDEGVLNPEDCVYITAVSPDVILELLRLLSDHDEHENIAQEDR